MKKDNELMTLRDDQIDKISELADEAFVASDHIKNKFVATAAEALDGPVSKLGLKQGNRLASPYIPDEYKDEIQIAIDDCLDGDDDYGTAIDQAISVTSQAINENEKIPSWVKSGVESFLLNIKMGILYLIEKRKAKKIEEE